MKINNFVKKSGLAIAISAMSVGAFAGTHSVDGGTGAPVLANEIFGAGSEDTLVAVPVNTYAVAGGSLAQPDAAPAVTVSAADATVKYTLDKGAVFGEDLSDIQKWADSNATLVFSVTDSAGDAGSVTVGGGSVTQSGAGAENFTVEVDQGGATGDNTVTFKVINNAANVATAPTLDSVQVGQFKVKNLTSALERGVANPAVRLGAEFRNVATADTDTQSAIVVLQSQDGVELDGNLTDYTVGGGRARIDVADTELSFTGDLTTNTGLNAGQDFDESDNVDYVTLGDLQVVRTTYASGAEIVDKENGDDFDFQGSDQPIVTISSTASVSGYSSIYLRPTGGACDATPVASDKVGVVQADGQSVQISLSGETTADLAAGYNVCAVAEGTDRIPESTFAANLDVTYFNPRYTNSDDSLDYGPVLRNGCQVTLFNLPHTGAQDDAFIRLTNVSELSGAVRAFIWTQDGQQIDVNSELLSSLDGHATTVLHTNENLQAGVFLGDVMPTYGAVTEGRHRLVVQGAFPACEALGLIRSPSGTLTNMTSTTYSGDDSRLGTEQSNTSNTSN